MKKVSIREAVKLYDVSRPTLSKALKGGTVSGVKDGKGQWQIDPAELARVYQPRKADTGNAGQNTMEDLATLNTPEIEHLKGALAAAEARANAAENRLSDKDAFILDLREDRDRWRQQATSLLEDKRPKGFFSRILGR